MNRPRPTITRGDLARWVTTWAGSTLALMVAGGLLPGLSADSRWSYVAVAGVAGVLGLVLRPLMAAISIHVGWLGVVAVALLGQAIVVYVAMRVVPGIRVDFWTAVLASWIASIVGTLIAYVTTAGTDDGLITSLARRGSRTSTAPDPEVDGVVFVQMDGVPFPVLRWAVQSGGVPTIRRWLASGDYLLREWTPQFPCTTPASQLGLLHGTVDGVPAFRWYDRELGRVLVANRPDDARVIEDRATTGSGLLWDDGVSISNLFSGDAPRSLMGMSTVAMTQGSAQTRRAMAWFLASPSGFSRSLTRTVAEVFKERWQARRQRRRDLEPRMERSWEFAFLRAATNGLLSDLNTALVAEEMRKGTHSIYVDYVEYDEIAHHAGMFRPESLAALDGLDRALAALERLSEGAPRRYRIVALSDHGQSQGRSFRDRHGEDLGGLCERLMAQRVQALETPVESWGRAESLVADVAPGGGVTGKVAANVEAHVERRSGNPGAATEPVVLGSGNLGLLYVPGPRRWSVDDLEHQWPDLVAGLVAHPGIGFVAGLDHSGAPCAIGPDGRHDLLTGEVTGQDPLRAYGEHAPRVLRRAVLMGAAPDLYINSVVDQHTDDVAAFEDLVGAHGGLGGAQDRAVLLVPHRLAASLPDRIEGADNLHTCLVDMLTACGHRRSRSPASSRRST